LETPLESSKAKEVAHRSTASISPNLDDCIPTRIIGHSKSEIFTTILFGMNLVHELHLESAGAERFGHHMNQRFALTAEQNALMGIGRFGFALKALFKNVFLRVQFRQQPFPICCKGC